MRSQVAEKGTNGFPCVGKAWESMRCYVISWPAQTLRGIWQENLMPLKTRNLNWEFQNNVNLNPTTAKRQLLHNAVTNSRTIDQDTRAI
jgi:hypothetical protein